MGALATVAMDSDQPALARSYAERGGDQHDALATLGMLQLGEQQTDQALATFERTLAGFPTDGRALLGKGLALLARGDPAGAAHCLDQATAVFPRHLGSCVAAGWAQVVKGDLPAARARFEQGLAVDDTFAELHGALAVLDILQGDPQSAERRAEVSVRLDRTAFSGALAKVMLLEGRGQHRAAERIRAAALNQPIGADGKTLAEALAAFAKGSGRG